jgi:hypothetical protein
MAGVRIQFTTVATDLSWLEDVEHVESISRSGPRVEVHGTGPVLVLVAAGLVAHGIVPTDLRVIQPALEEVYFDLTEGNRGEDGNAGAG